MGLNRRQLAKELGVEEAFLKRVEREAKLNRCPYCKEPFVPDKKSKYTWKPNCKHLPKGWRHNEG